MKNISIVLALTFLCGCTIKKNNFINTNSPINFVSKIMMNPDLFLEKEIIIFGILDSSRDRFKLIPSELFEDLETIYLIDSAVFVSSKKMSQKEIEKLNACKGQLVTASGFFYKLNNGTFHLAPNIIETIEKGEGLLLPKTCFSKINWQIERQ